MSRRQPIDYTTATPTDRRGVLFLACAFAGFALIVVLLAGTAWPLVVERLLIDGGVALLWVTACTGIGEGVIKLLGITCDSKALRFATSAGVGIGIVSLLVLGLGLSGVLNRTTAIVLMVIGLCAAIAHLRAVKLHSSSFKPSWVWLILVGPAAITAVAALVPPGILWGDEPHGYDVVEYHLQVPREWYESGRIEPLKHNVFSYFPFNVEMHYLLAMHLKGGPWAGMYLAQLMNLVMIALTVIAMAGIATPQAAVLAGAVPWMMLLGSVAYNECGLLLFGTLSVGWAIRAQKFRDFIFAGALAGLACGTKLTAVPMLVLAVPLALSFPLSLRERVGVKAVVGFAIAGLIAFSPWLLRNAVWTRNPIFPEGMSLLGRAHFSETQAVRWTKAHSARPGDRTTAIWKQVLADWRYGFVFVPLAIAAAVLGRHRTSRLLIAILIVQFVFWIGFTHVQGRFLVLAIPIAAMLIAQVDLPHWNKVVSAVALMVAASGCIAAAPRVRGAAPALGAGDIAPLTPEVAADEMKSGRALVLVGDARAFCYSIPMASLRYRTVFDVDVKPGQTLIDAWMGGNHPADAAIVVTPSELQRFAKTYWMIPPTEFPASEPYVLPP